MNQQLIIEPLSAYVIRFGDCDPFGHLNNARYIDYMVSAREDHLSEFYHFNMQSFLAQGLGWVVSQHEIVYLKPAKLYEKIYIQTTLIDVSDYFVQVEAQMLNEEQKQIKAVLWTKYHHVSVSIGKKQTHSPELMKFFFQLKNDKIDLQAGMASRVGELLGKSKSVSGQPSIR